MFDIWGEGSSFEEMLAAVAAHPAHLKAPFLAPDASFKVILSTVGFKWGEAQYQQHIRTLVGSLGFEGEVELQTPRNTFWVVTVESDGESGIPAMPTRWVFGRQVALGDRCARFSARTFHAVVTQSSAYASWQSQYSMRLHCDSTNCGASSRRHIQSGSFVSAAVLSPYFAICFSSHLLSLPYTLSSGHCWPTMPCPSVPTLAPPPWTLSLPSS